MSFFRNKFQPVHSDQIQSEAPPAPLCSLYSEVEMCIIRIVGLFKDGLSGPLNLLP